MNSKQECYFNIFYNDNKWHIVAVWVDDDMTTEIQGDLTLTEQDVKDFHLWIGSRTEHIGFKVGCKDKNRKLVLKGE